jgi:hypothetical protein
MDPCPPLVKSQKDPDFPVSGGQPSDAVQCTFSRSVSMDKMLGILMCVTMTTASCICIARAFQRRYPAGRLRPSCACSTGSRRVLSLGQKNPPSPCHCHSVGAPPPEGRFLSAALCVAHCISGTLKTTSKAFMRHPLSSEGVPHSSPVIHGNFPPFCRREYAIGDADIRAFRLPPAAWMHPCG